MKRILVAMIAGLALYTGAWASGGSLDARDMPALQTTMFRHIDTHSPRLDAGKGSQFVVFHAGIGNRQPLHALMTAGKVTPAE